MISIQTLRYRTLNIAAIVTSLVPFVFIASSFIRGEVLASSSATLTTIAMFLIVLLSVCTLWLIRRDNFSRGVTVYLAGSLLVTVYASFFATSAIFLARMQLGMALLIHLALALESQARAWRWVIAIVILSPILITIRRIVHPDGILADPSFYMLMMAAPVMVFLAMGTIGSLTLRALHQSINLATQRADTLEATRRDLVAARDQALSSTRAKSAFLATMSHELRTPLNVIIGYSELVLESVPKEFEFRPEINRVRGAGQLLLGLINEVLDLAKIEAGKTDVVVTRFSLRTLLGEISEMTAILARSSTIDILLEAPAGPMMLSTDRMKLRQILVNLVANAAKFTQRGSIAFSVEKGEKLVISVRDTGIGISGELLEKIFEPFTQADGTPSREYQGSGLGLSIARKLSEILGGTLSAKSSLGTGSVFTLTLPGEICDDSTRNDVLPPPAT